MCRTAWNHVTRIQSLVRRYPCEPFDAPQVLSCPAGLINVWSFIRFAGTWWLARSLTIPQTEAAVCHCNFMLIERSELFKIFLSPIFIFLHCPLVLFFYFFSHLYTKKSKFNPKWNIIIIINNGFRLWQIHCYKKRCREDPWRNTTACRLWCIVKKYNVLRLVPQETDVLSGAQVPNNTA